MRVREVVQNTPATTRGSRLARRVGRRWRVEAETSTGVVLIVQNAGHTPGGALIDALRARSLEPRIVDAAADAELPDPRSLVLAVILGGGAGDGERDWVRRADGVGTPVIALGSAATALATALGGGAAPARWPRRAWIELRSADPVQIPCGPYLAWEDETIEVPPHGEVLAHDHLGPQVFRVGPHLGIQVNPHVTPETVRAWVAGSREVLDGQGILEATWRDHARASDAAHRLFARLLDAPV